jgi:non-specific serine/threonine protein kinase
VCGDAGDRERRTGDGKAHSAPAVPRDDVLSGLTGLVDKSLVQAEERDGDVRYTLLETVRQYAWERLQEAGEVAALRDAHLAWCLALASRGEAEALGPGWKASLRRLENELDNLRAALDWCKSDAARAETGLSLASALWRFWAHRGHIHEGRRHLNDLLTAPGAADAEATRLKALVAVGHLEHISAEFGLALEHLEEAVALLRPAGPSVELGRAISQIAMVTLNLGDVHGAIGRLEEVLAMARCVADPDLEASTQFFLGITAQERGDLSESARRLQTAVAIRRRHGQESSLGLTIFELATVALLEADLGRAAELYCESLGIWRDLGDPVGLAIGLGGFAWLAAECGQAVRATRLAGAASAHRWRSGVAVFATHHRFHAALTERTRAQLGEESWHRAWSEGEAMTLEQAVAFALEDEGG